MALIDVIKMDQLSEDFVVEKFMSEHQWELRTGSQLIVNEGQEAIFVKGGQALDTFTPGTHTLSTGNIPLLRKIVNLPFGSQTPFTSEVWFINKTVRRNLNWGTPHRIALFDPKLDFPVNVASFGKWGFKIVDSQSFVRQIVGAKISVDSRTIEEYFIGELVEKLSQTLSNYICGGFSVFQITAKLAEISSVIRTEVANEFSNYGVELENFTISSINLPPEEMKMIQNVQAEKMKMQQLGGVAVGQGYLANQQLEIMREAAKNGNSMMGAAAGMGMGFAAGFPMGQQIAQNVMNPAVQQTQPQAPAASSAPAASDPMAILKSLKQLFEAGLITQDEYNQKRLKILDQL